MTIPTIEPYPLPTAADLPRSTAAWRPDRSRVALLIHDLQNYFVDCYPPGQSPVAPMLSNVARLRARATACGVPVLYSAQPAPMSRAERGLLMDIWGPGMGGDPQRSQIAAAVRPGPTDHIVRKRRYSAFHGTELADLLAELGRDQLLVCGVFAHLGCLVTATDAFSRDIEVFLVGDGIADFSAAHHRMALEYAARACAVALTTEAVLECLG